MKSGKQFVRKMVSRLGYDIVRKPSGSASTLALEAALKKTPPPVRPEDLQNGIRFRNFENLIGAYEFRLNELSGHTIICPNPTRPKLLARLLGTPPSEAYYLIQALAEACGLPGDICEFGVAQGETSALIANEIMETNKIFHLFDSFQGLPKPTDKDLLKDDIFSLGSIESYAGTMSLPREMVLERLESISFPPSRYVVHAGFIEELILTDANLPSRVSFAYVDFDLYEPIRVALEFLDSVIVPGARIIVDDYDFFSTGAKTAVDEFVSEKNSEMIKYEICIPNTQYGCFAILSRQLNSG